MKRIFSTLSFIAIVIALTVGCDKTDENEVPNIPLEVSTQSVSVEKGKVFPEAKKGGNKSNEKYDLNSVPEPPMPSKKKKDGAVAPTITAGSGDYSVSILNKNIATIVLKENNAAIYVTGVEVGTTTIVVTDNYTKQTKEIGVKVTAAKQGGNNGNNNGGGKGGNNGGGKKK